ncbi:MAG: DNA double-strand break repair nuclease NurA [Desulfotomaculum sp.]|nr:DNA double-strand break repair nuclease NurA [Desulfotomaculum sp.]
MLISNNGSVNGRVHNMLNLSSVYPHIEKMIKEYKLIVDDNKQKLNKASETLNSLKGELSKIQKRVQESKTTWLAAEPVEDPAVFHPLPPVPSNYVVMASDGSQLFPDHHEVVLCYLINIGTAVLEYGDSPAAALNNQPMLYYREEDLYIEYDGVKRLVDSQQVAAARALEELKALAVMSSEYKSRQAAALSDGSLIHWGTNQQEKEEEKYFKVLVSCYETLRQNKTPVAGYISGTRSTDVINMLRLQLCPYTPVNCDHCRQHTTPPAVCESVGGLRDASLFSGFLKEGWRSALFKSRSKILEKYGDHEIYFFYVNIGSEVIRVEVPRWTAQNTGYLNRVHSVVVDQALKGRGYPVCLTEAHQQAVVDGSDRRLFYELVNKKLIENGLTSEITCKSLRKRSVPV